jgi:lysozyme
MTFSRIAVASLTLSAMGFVAILGSEGFTPTAIIPTDGDRQTVGFGSTYRDDGTPVRPGDTITPVQAVKRSVSHIAKGEAGLKRCVTGSMTQGEYDTLVDFAYQYGTGATCGSSVVRHVNAGRYAQACEAYTLYKFSGGFDCSTPGNKVCAGVWARNLDRRASCLGAQP